MHPGAGSILRNKPIVLHHLDRSPVLQHRLKWGPCSPLDGLIWTLQHGATRFYLHLAPPPSVNLADQLGGLDTAALVPSPPGPLFASPGGTPGAAAGAYNKDATTQPPRQQPGLEETARKPPKRLVLSCSWEGEHGCLVFLQLPLATPDQVRPLQDGRRQSMHIC